LVESLMMSGTSFVILKNQRTPPLPSPQMGRG
jgi:hypothetical protein